MASDAEPAVGAPRSDEAAEPAPGRSSVSSGAKCLEPESKDPADQTLCVPSSPMCSLHSARDAFA